VGGTGAVGAAVVKPNEIVDCSSEVKKKKCFCLHYCFFATMNNATASSTAAATRAPGELPLEAVILIVMAAVIVLCVIAILILVCLLRRQAAAKRKRDLDAANRKGALNLYFDAPGAAAATPTPGLYSEKSLGYNASVAQRPPALPAPLVDLRTLAAHNDAMAQQQHASYGLEKTDSKTQYDSVPQQPTPPPDAVPRPLAQSAPVHSAMSQPQLSPRDINTAHEPRRLPTMIGLQYEKLPATTSALPAHAQCDSMRSMFNDIYIANGM
jgi:hypothetical protein